MNKTITLNFLTRDRYNQCDEEELEQIEWLIEDLHAIAVKDLSMSLEDTVVTIRNIFSDFPEKNELTLKLFKTAYANQDIAGTLDAHANLNHYLKLGI
jgi:hypothetical protein